MKDSVNPDTGMTTEEREVMDALVAAWNRFSALPNSSQDVTNDFRRSIHECQRILSQRVVSRAYPNYWR